MLRKESPRSEAKRSDVTERANIKKSAPAESIDQPEPDEREYKIGDTDADRLQQRRLRAQAGQFKDARGEVQNCVDARELIEERDQDSEQDRFAETAGPEISR